MDETRELTEAELRRKYPPYEISALVRSLAIHDKNITSFQDALNKEIRAKDETIKLISECEERDKEIEKARKRAVIQQLQGELGEE